MITIREETMAALGEYAKVSIAFTVESRYVAVPIGGVDGGWRLIEERVDPPWVKDYDGGEPPNRWLRWDTTNWRILSAFAGDERVGGAIVVHDSPELDFLEGRDDLAALWDIRVARRGEGAAWGRCCSSASSDMPQAWVVSNSRSRRRTSTLTLATFMRNKDVGWQTLFPMRTQVGRMRWSSTGCWNLNQIR